MYKITLTNQISTHHLYSLPSLYDTLSDIGALSFFNLLLSRYSRQGYVFEPSVQTHTSLSASAQRLTPNSGSADLITLTLSLIPQAPIN